MTLLSAIQIKVNKFITFLCSEYILNRDVTYKLWDLYFIENDGEINVIKECSRYDSASVFF